MKANHLDVVQDEHARQPPTSSDLASCFRFEQRVLARLAREFPDEAWGYLAKGGENTIPYLEDTIKVGRVCGPDGQLYKLLTDIPTTNDPIWSDDGNVAEDFHTSPAQFYRRYDGAGGGGGPFPVPTPGPTPVPAPPPIMSPQDVADSIAVMQTFNETLRRIADAVQTHESMQVLRHADVVAHFDEVKRILAAQTFEGEVQIRYLGTAKVTLRPVNRG